MEANRKDLDGLIRLQQIDTDLAKQRKALDELPQREVILKARKKRENMLDRQVKVQQLEEKARKQRMRIEDEDSSLAKKEEDAQAALDSVRGDFRNVEARNKEIDSIAKRRATLAEDHAQAEAELKKIEDVAEQIDLVIKDADKTEEAASDSYQEEGSKIKASIAQLEKQREELTADMSPDIVKLYDKTAALTGNVVVGALKDDRCGVCRSTFESGRLIDLRSQAPLGVCPACKRLLIIE